MFSINDGVFGFTGKPVKVLLSLFITSIGGLDEREMVRKIFGSIEHVMVAIKYFMNSETQTSLYISNRSRRELNNQNSKQKQMQLVQAQEFASGL